MGSVRVSRVLLALLSEKIAYEMVYTNIMGAMLGITKS